MPEENHVLNKSCAETVLTAMETALSQVDKPCAFSSFELFAAPPPLFGTTLLYMSMIFVQ
eukprot:1743684-Amphidinium_carterae.1